MADLLTASRSGPLVGEVRVPGDKSLSHRAVIMAAMARGESRIAGLSDGDDVGRTVDAVRALGASVRQDRDGSLIIGGGQWRSPGGPIDCGNSGTSARLLMGAVAGRPVSAAFVGDASLSRRPMARVTEPLRRMGASIEGGDRLPITISGGALHGIRFSNLTGSAQVKSAVLLAGLGASGVVEVIEPRPSRDHSERMLSAFGVQLSRINGPDGAQATLPEVRSLTPAAIEISGDPSSAAFPLVAALICPGSRVTVRNLLANPLRTGLYAALEDMGARLVFANRREVSGEPVADVTAEASSLRAITLAGDRAPAMIDEYPILAVAAACAQGETAMHGLGELRHKESDRLAAIVAGLAGCGIHARVEGDSLFVRGGVSRGGDVVTRGDHRIAMSFLVLGLASAAPVRVDEAAMIGTSFPGFTPLMRSLGAQIA